MQNAGYSLEKWLDSVPNDGLIYYTSLLNDERVLITKPEGLHEVLSTKVYDFSKPPIAKLMLKRIFGEGLPFYEGETHKVCLFDRFLFDTLMGFQNMRKQLMPAFSYRHIKDLSTLFRAKSIDCLVRAGLD